MLDCLRPGAAALAEAVAAVSAADGPQGAADCRLAGALAGGRGDLDVVVEDDAELQDGEQHHQQHGQDQGELDDRLACIICASLEQRDPRSERWDNKTERRRAPDLKNKPGARQDVT